MYSNNRKFWELNVQKLKKSKPNIWEFMRLLWCNSCSKRYGMDCFRYILHTCPNPWCNSSSKCYGMDCFRYILHTCPSQWCNSCSKLLRNGLLALHTSHMCRPVHKVLRNGLLSVHTSHMSKPVMSKKRNYFCATWMCLPQQHRCILICTWKIGLKEPKLW